MILKYYYDSNHKIKATHNISTRFITNHKYVLPPHINNYGKKTRNFQIPVIFNSIPRNRLALNTYSSTKSEIRSFKINQNSIYTPSIYNNYNYKSLSILYIIKYPN